MKKRSADLKRAIRRAPPIPQGNERVWLRCRECREIYYKNYIPFGYDVGITCLPCFHNFGHRTIYDVCDTLLTQKFRRRKDAS